MRAGRVSENTVAQLMRELGLAARRRRRRKQTTRQGRGRWRAADGPGLRWRSAELEFYRIARTPTVECQLPLMTALSMAPSRLLPIRPG